MSKPSSETAWNIGGFHSDAEARDWISAKSAAYFKAREH
jgi:hypothetical protein